MFIEYEEMLLNTKVAPYQSLHQGFVVNHGGMEQFTAAIHPLYNRNINTAKKIEDMEAYLMTLDLQPTYRIILQKDYQPFDEELYRRGYERNGQGLVKKIDIQSMQKELFTFANFIENGIFVDRELKDIWLADHRHLMGYSDNQINIVADGLIREVLPCAFFTFVEESTLLGQAQVCFYQDKMIIGQLVINKRFRTLSYGRRLLMSVLSYGLKNGAVTAIADVDFKNVSALKLFAKTTFEDHYAYFYRTKLTKTEKKKESIIL